VRAAPPRAPRPARLEAALGYEVGVPRDPTWLSHRASLRLGAPLGRLPLAVELDAAIGSRPTGGPPGYRVALLDAPIGLALLARLRLGRFLLAGGPRASLHVLAVDAAAPDGRAGSARALAAGLGAALQARVALTAWLAAALTVVAEGLVPDRRFTVDGAAGAGLGPFEFAASVGLVFRVF
jgi:hypothetical protein